MKTSHTPGPWHLGMKPGPMVYGPSGEQVANMHVAMLEQEEHKANARLIAAAPELLDILKEIIIQEVDSAKHGIYGIASSLVTQAQEAIRKVEQS